MERRTTTNGAEIHRSCERQFRLNVSHTGSLSAPAQHVGYCNGRQPLVPHAGHHLCLGRRQRGCIRFWTADSLQPPRMVGYRPAADGVPQERDLSFAPSRRLIATDWPPEPKERPGPGSLSSIHKRRIFSNIGCLATAPSSFRLREFAPCPIAATSCLNILPDSRQVWRMLPSRSPAQRCQPPSAGRDVGSDDLAASWPFRCPDNSALCSSRRALD